MQLHTNTSGHGERHVALVHGLGGSGAVWQPLVDLMLATGKFTVTTVDLRGHGNSDRATSYSLASHADDLVHALPEGLHSVVGHSLGGSVLVRAVARLRPMRAIYLDPGFQLSLPTSGVAGKLFWAVPAVTLTAASLPQARRAAKLQASYSSTIQALMSAAQKQFDTKMATSIFREVAFNPVDVGPPVVPSTIVLSDDSPKVLSDARAAELERAGWELRRLPGVHHDMHLESPARLLHALKDHL